MCDDLVEDNERVPDLDIVLALQAHHQRLRNLFTATAQILATVYKNRI